MANEIMAYSSENGPHKWEEVCEQLAGEGVTEEELDVIAALMYDPIEKVSLSNKPLPVEGTYAEDDIHQSGGDLYNKVYKGNGVWEEKLVGFDDWAKLFWEAARAAPRGNVAAPKPGANGGWSADANSPQFLISCEPRRHLSVTHDASPYLT